MKNRVLSVLLSISIVFSNFSTSFVAYAVGDEPALTETTEIIEPTIDTNEGDTEEGEIDSDEESSEEEVKPDSDEEPSGEEVKPDIDEEPSEEEVKPDIDEEPSEDELNPDDEVIEDEKTVINVSLKEGKNLTIYYGQEDVLDYIYNFHNNDGKPRYVEFFDFKLDDKFDGMYDNIKAEFKKVAEGVEENKVAYSVNFSFRDSALKLNDNYKIECEKDFVFELSYDYTPEYKVLTDFGEDGAIYLKSDNPDYAVSTTNAENSFSESQVMLSGDNKYYLRNINKESVEYYAISKEYNVDTDIEISQNAIVTQGDINFSNMSAYNKDVTVEITAYAKASNAKIILLNNNVPTTDKPIEMTRERFDTNKGKNMFTYEYTFEAPENDVLRITNLRAKVTVDNAESSVNLTLKDKNGKKCCNGFIIETVRPEIKIDWNNKNLKSDPMLMHIWIKDINTYIDSVYYKCEDDTEWFVPKNLNSYQNNYGKDNYIELQFPKSKTKTIHYWRITDAAGNEKYIYRDPYDKANFWNIVDELPSRDSTVDKEIITGVELWYYENESWIEINNSSVLHSPSSINALNKELLQIRIKIDGKHDVYINQKMLDYHSAKTDEKGDLDGEYDYYYYTIKCGEKVDFLVVSIDTTNGGTLFQDLKSKMNQELGNSISCDRFVVENTKPTVELKRPNFTMSHKDGKDWYGMKNKEEYFEIKVEDYGSGINIESIDVTDNNTTIKATEDNPIKIQINGLQEFKNITSSFSPQTYNGLITNVNIKIPIVLFNDGDHSLKISVEDNAGNSETGFAIINGIENTETDTESKIVTNKPFTFSTDFTPPKGEITVNGGNVINNALWFNFDSNSNVKVSIDLKIEDEYPLKVVWYAQNKESGQTISYINDGEKTKTKGVIHNVDTSVLIDNAYTINAIFYDQVGNSSNDIVEEKDKVKEKTFYIDTTSPKIKSVSVSCAPKEGIEKVLRILTFGIFAKDKITITVKASDGEHDSGLNENSLQISLDGGSENSYIDISNGEYKDKDGVWEYKYTIDLEQAGTIALKLKDNIGKETSEFVEICLANDDSLKYVSDDSFEYLDDGSRKPKKMLIDSDHPAKFIYETNPPSIVITLPESDGIDGVIREDEEIWYRYNPNYDKDEEKDKDKKIIITVQDDKEEELNASDYEESGLHKLTILVNNKKLDSDFIIVNDEEPDSKFLREDGEDIVWEHRNNELHEYALSINALHEMFDKSDKPSNDGHYAVKVIAEDNACNINEVEVDYYIDDTPPIVEDINFYDESADENSDDNVLYEAKLYEKLEYGYYFKKAVNATVIINDENPTSGLYGIEYKLVPYSNSVNVNVEPQKALILSDNDDAKGTATFEIPANFKGQILVTASDYVQNKSPEVTPDLFVVDTPEKHESEEHIEISDMGKTSFTDAQKHPLFAHDVSFTVLVRDTMSGIRDITYALDSEKITQVDKTITLKNSGYSVGQNIGDGWIIKSMDKNLVTEVERVYTFSEDNNNILVKIGMVDRANNESSKESGVFTVDKTAPIINVAFNTPKGNADCYQEKREATIKIIERNFDPSRIIYDIQNTFGDAPSIGTFKDDSDTEHTVTIIFSEGDYAFDISGTDRCDHRATVNYTGGNERSFRVDLTDPVVSHNFNQLVNNAENSFNSSKEVKITVTEHNFNQELVNIKVYRIDAGKMLTEDNRQDCTSEYINQNRWHTVGDTHTINLTFSNDYVYQVTIAGMDVSGRSIPAVKSPVFEIDQKKPVLKTPVNLKALVYTDDATIQPIEFEDNNIARVDYSVVSYRMKKNEEKIGYDVAVDSKNFETKNGTVTIGDEFLKQDGIYEVKCVPYDVAGNVGEETTHTYVIQREADFLVYIPNSNKENKTGLYKFDRTGIRSADFEDIEIVSYLTTDKTFSVEIDGAEIPSTDISTEIVNMDINQVNVHDVIVKSSYITQNFSEDTVDTDLTLNAVARDGDTSQMITLGHIYIDNVKPVGEYEKSVQDIGFFDGFYGVKSRTLMIEGVSPDIALDKCEVMVNDRLLTYKNGGLQYNEDSHIISFMIDEGYSSIRTTLVDNAGNTNSLSMIKKVYVGSLFGRWWYLFVLGGLVVVAIPTCVIFTIIRKKKNRTSS
ncbi:MAG: hypothetical protein E7510_09810 [Ruminococcus sp.]|nr:hypothetical protein [Ruminococcus sp.]